MSTKSTKSIEETEDFKKLSAFLVWNQLEFARVGSSTIPGVTNPGDYDILVLEKDGMVFEWAEKHGWEHGGSNLPDSEFDSFKNWTMHSFAEINPPPINLIIAREPKFYKTFLDSNSVCVEANLVHKYDRAAVFEYMRNPMSGNTISEKDFVDLVKGKSLYEKKYGVPF